MATPCVIFSSCSDFPAENIIKDVLKVEALPNGETLIEDIIGFNWEISTKYYTADVKLCLVKERTIGDQHFAESVQGFVVHFEPDKKETFERVKLWSPFLDQIDPEIKMLVCDRCGDDNAISRLTAQTWCIDNGFELVELNPEIYSDSDTEDDFEETTGLKRIVQSLHAHTWPNLVLKDSRQTVSPYIRQLMKEQHDLHVSQAENDENQATQENQNADNTLVTTDPGSGDCGAVMPESSDIDCSTCNKDTETSIGINEKGDNLSNSVTDGYVEQAEPVVIKGDNSHTDKGVTKGDKCVDCGISEGGKCPLKGEKVSEGGSGATKGRNSGNKKKEKQPSKEERLDGLLPSQDLDMFAALGSDDPEGESFEKLFEKFAQMKEKASNLPLDERKKYAENVAIAFWKAMGGDEDEIGDLDD